MPEEHEFQKVLKGLKKVNQDSGGGQSSIPTAFPSPIEQARNQLKPTVVAPKVPSPSPGTNLLQQQLTHLQHVEEDTTDLQRWATALKKGKMAEDPGARDIHALALKKKSHLRHEVSLKVQQVMSGMPPPWNATYSWHARFAMYLVDKELLIEIRAVIDEGSLTTQERYETRYKWRMAIEQKWQNLALIWHETGSGGTTPHTIPMRVVMTFDSLLPNAHCKIKPNAPNTGTAGTHGVGGTNNMTTWGTGDPLDIPHEVGHMLGAPDNYGHIVFNNNPHDPQSLQWPLGRVQGYGVMNNPAEDPVPRNIWLIQQEFPTLMAKFGRNGTVHSVVVNRL